jgi:hypothetical protein
VPRKPPSDINSTIDRELAAARARWGETFELKCLEGSRGDTLDHEDVLRMLRYFRKHDTVYARVLARVEADSSPAGR